MDNLSNNQSLKIFSNEAFGQFRTAGTADNPLFCLADVCKILSIGNPSDVKKRLDDGVVSIESIVDSLGRKQNVTFINEDGLYDVILDSRKPEAKKFRKWVTSEVLPAIRKIGKFEVKQSREALIANALIAAKEVINELLPKAKAYDAIINKFDSVSWRDFCNKIRDTFGVKENEIREKLIAEHWIYKTNTLCGKTKYKPYKETIDRDLMIVKDVLCNDGEVRPANFFTYKGQQQLIDWFAPVVVD